MTMQVQRSVEAQVVTRDEVDLDAMLEEAGRALLTVQAAGRDTSALTPDQRHAVLAGLSKALGLNPLSQPVIFLKTQGREVAYVTKVGTDQIASRLRLRRKTIQGPDVRKIHGRDLVFCQVEVTAPDGRSEMSTATLPIGDIVTDLMKCETKAKRRATLSIAGLGLLSEDDTDGMSEVYNGGAEAAAASTFAEALAHAATCREVRAAWQQHRPAMGDNTREPMAAVSNWLTEHGVVVDSAGTTALLSTLPEEALDVLDDGATGAGDAPEKRERAIVLAGRECRGAEWDEHSRKTVWDALVRGYAALTGCRSLKVAGQALRDLCEKIDEPEPPPTGTDGPARPEGEGADAEGFAAHQHQQRSDEGARASLRVVRDHTDEELITSAAAWRAYLATCNPFRVQGAWRALEGAFSREGVRGEREHAALTRLAECGDVKDPAAWLHARPRAKRDKAA